MKNKHPYMKKISRLIWIKLKNIKKQQMN